LADAAAFGEVLEGRQDFLVRELGVEQRCPLELGELRLRGVAIEQAVVRLGEVVADREIAGVTPAVLRAVRVLAAEASEVVRRHEASRADPCERVSSWTTSLTIGKISFN